VLDLMENLDLDTQQETPGRGVVRHIGASLVKAMELALESGPPEAAQIVACESVVHAETKDHLNWELLHESAKAQGEEKKALLRKGRGRGGRASLPYDRLVPGTVDRVAWAPGGPLSARGREESEDGYRRSARRRRGRSCCNRSDAMGVSDEAGAVIEKNVEQAAKLEAEQLHAPSISERMAGAVTRMAGTASFAVAHLLWFLGWIVVNTGLVRRVRPFDPSPFNLFTMIVSLEAIFLSIRIFISQNQMTRQANRREHVDLQVNLLAEQESTATLRIVQRIAEHLGLALRP
jgi:uncharacterized membrane protein